MIADSWMTRMIAVLVVSSVAGAGSMVLYQWLSPQRRLQEIKYALQAAQERMSAYDGDFAGLWKLIRQNLSLAGKQVAYSLGPSLGAGVPMILLGFNLDVMHRQVDSTISRPVQTAIVAADITQSDRTNESKDAPSHQDWFSADVEYFPRGPGWMRSWIAVFVVGSTVAAMTTRWKLQLA